MDRLGLRRHIRLGTEVTGAHWDGAGWVVEIDGAEPIRARALVTAWGQLNRPTFRDIPGREEFRGESWHSARWNHDVDLAGKRVACIGNGASAVQFIPEIAPVVGAADRVPAHANYVVPRLDRPYEPVETAGSWSSRARCSAIGRSSTGSTRAAVGAAAGQPVAADHRGGARAPGAGIADPELRERL